MRRLDIIVKIIRNLTKVMTCWSCLTTILKGAITLVLWCNI